MTSLTDRYNDFIADIIKRTLKGEFRSKAQVYQCLVKALEAGTGEIFERCLTATHDRLQHQADTETSELKQAKLTRQLRAIGTLADAWDTWQAEHQAQSLCDSAIESLVQAAPETPLLTLVHWLDPNRTPSLSYGDLQDIAQALNTAVDTQTHAATAAVLQQLHRGINSGLAAYTSLEPHLVSWLYENRRAVGFGGEVDTAGPWSLWAKHLQAALPQALFQAQARNQSAANLVAQQPSFDLTAWVTLAVLLRQVQLSLVKWFDAQPYDLQAGKNLAGVTYLVFAIIWSELSQGAQAMEAWPRGDRQQLSQSSFQLCLHSLRTFAQRDNFPLYGGVFASLSGETFRDTLDYLDQPLKAVENTQEKARILTVLGNSQRRLGRYDRAWSLHQTALELAQAGADPYCATANLNHLSRLQLVRQHYDEAANLAQRALIEARQRGDRPGEANALVSLGYSQVMAAQHQGVATAETLTSPLQFLETGQTLAQRQGDLHSQAFAAVGLGVAYTALEQPDRAQAVLTAGLTVLQQVGDRGLYALSCAYLGEACYQKTALESAVLYALLGMYLLYQLQQPSWRHCAGLLTILQGQVGRDRFQSLLHQHQGKLVAEIGADGYDYLPTLLNRYRESTQ
jgi:tetratricopeptide (TPR) repeat protein